MEQSVVNHASLQELCNVLEYLQFFYFLEVARSMTLGHRSTIFEIGTSGTTVRILLQF